MQITLHFLTVKSPNVSNRSLSQATFKKNKIRLLSSQTYLNSSFTLVEYYFKKSITDSEVWILCKRWEKPSCCDTLNKLFVISAWNTIRLLLRRNPRILRGVLAFTLTFIASSFPSKRLPSLNWIVFKDWSYCPFVMNSCNLTSSRGQ